MASGVCAGGAAVAAAAGATGGVGPQGARIALIASVPPPGSTISLSAPPTILLRFKVVCRDDGVTFLAAQLNTAAGPSCISLQTTGNGVDARSGKATEIDAQGSVYPSSFGTTACPIPVDLTSVDVTSAPSQGGGLGVIAPFYYDTCYVNQRFPLNYEVVQ